MVFNPFSQFLKFQYITPPSHKVSDCYAVIVRRRRSGKPKSEGFLDLLPGLGLRFECLRCSCLGFGFQALGSGLCYFKVQV